MGVGRGHGSPPIDRFCPSKLSVVLDALLALGGPRLGLRSGCASWFVVGENIVEWKYIRWEGEGL